MIITQNQIPGKGVSVADVNYRKDFLEARKILIIGVKKMAVYYKNGVKYVGSAATREQQKDAKAGTQTTSTPTTTNNTATSSTSRTPSTNTGYVTSQPNTTSGFKSAADAD